MNINSSNIKANPNPSSNKDINIINYTTITI